MISEQINNSRQELASYSLTQYRLIGSYARGTAIRDFSDIDIMLVFQNTTTPAQLESQPLLAGIRRILEQSTDSSIHIFELQEVVQVEYPSGLHFDILPALKNDSQSYLIPDGMNGWRVTDPDAQMRYFRTQDTASRIRLPEFTRGLKYWNATHGQLIRSYHLESIAAHFGPHLDTDYTIATHDIFQKLSRTVCIADPVGRQGELSSYLSTSHRNSVTALCREAAARALMALKAQASQDHDGALAAWASVYGPRFPNPLPEPIRRQLDQRSPE
jgi:predicted nucleotidyltransferase